jgi:exonuclease III
MILNILQWNINGYHDKYTEIEYMIKTKNPHLICLQETLLKSNTLPTTPKAYSGYFHNLPQNLIAKQGTGILVHKSIPHQPINILSNLSVVAVQVNIKYPITIVCIYIPPKQTCSYLDLTSLLSQIQTPVILAGDFNGWSPLWGSPTYNKRGKIVENFILNSSLITLNDGSPTHFSTHGTFTCIDLTLCSPQILPLTSWTVDDDLHGSNHFPIITQIRLDNHPKTLKKKPTQYNCNKANWEKFRNKLLQLNIDLPSQNVNKEAALILKKLRTAANYSIPTTHNKNKRIVPWWTKELGNLREEKQDAWKKFKRTRVVNDLIDYKRKNALFIREKKNRKPQSLKT